MRCVGHNVVPSSSATACRLSAAPWAGPCAPEGSNAACSARSAPGATARWKRLGRSTTKKRMAVVLGRQGGARRRRWVPGGTVTAGGPCPSQRGAARADGTDAAKRQDGKATHTAMADRGARGTTGAGRDGAGACTRQSTARERASGGLAGSSRHGLLGFTATTGTFHAGAPEMKVRDYCAAT